MIDYIAHAIVVELVSLGLKCEYDNTQPLKYDNIIVIYSLDTVLSFDDDCVLMMIGEATHMAEYSNPSCVDIVLDLLEDKVLEVYYTQISKA